MEEEAGEDLEADFFDTDLHLGDRLKMDDIPWYTMVCHEKKHKIDMLIIVS